MNKLYQIYFYVPVNYAEEVKEAMFAAGAGRVGEYDKCSWQVLGEGQFRPLEGANPFLGEHKELERLKEYRVEMVVAEKFLEDTITALKETHPYEEVAYGVIEILL